MADTSRAGSVGSGLDAGSADSNVSRPNCLRPARLSRSWLILGVGLFAAVTDYEMPVLKGDELTAAIKAAAQHQPSSMFTGYAEAMQSSVRPPRGVDLVIGKPFSF